VPDCVAVAVCLQITKSAAEQAALAYANAKLAYVRERIQELGNKFPPELHILHPSTFSPAHTCPSQQLSLYQQLHETPSSTHLEAAS
jgi:hypothetical protein